MSGEERMMTRGSKARAACHQLLAERQTVFTSYSYLSHSYRLSYLEMTSETIEENWGRSFALCSFEMDKEIHINLKSHITSENSLQLETMVTSCAVLPLLLRNLN